MKQPASRAHAKCSSLKPSTARSSTCGSAADVSSNNRVRLLRDGPATFDAMLELIEQARTSLALESYIFRSDEVGRRFGDALTRAAGRGVAVRVLLDWIGARGTSRAFIRELIRAGIDLQIFNRPGLRRWFGLVPRDHRKLLVVDEP